MDRHPLEEGRGGELRVQPLGDGDEPLRRDHQVLGVGPLHVGEGHPVPGPHPHHAFPHLLHHPGPLLPQGEGGGHGVEALPLVGVNEVHPDGEKPHQDLPGPRLRDRKLLEPQDLRSAHLVHPYGPHGESLPCGRAGPPLDAPITLYYKVIGGGEHERQADVGLGMAPPRPGPRGLPGVRLPGLPGGLAGGWGRLRDLPGGGPGRGVLGRAEGVRGGLPRGGLASRGPRGLPPPRPGPGRRKRRLPPGPRGAGLLVLPGGRGWAFGVGAGYALPLGSSRGGWYVRLAFGGGRP